MSERKSLVRWWWAWDFDKEEAWLNRMAEEGWALADICAIVYTFERTQPGEYVIRLENRKNDSEYSSFLKELEVEKVGSFVNWNYYRRKTIFGEFDLFSDLKSKITHIKRIERMLLPILILNMGIGIINTVNQPHVGYINLLCAVLLAYGLGCFRTKREMLEKESELQE